VSHIPVRLHQQTHAIGGGNSSPEGFLFEFNDICIMRC
jgi:hypothetical protein